MIDNLPTYIPIIFSITVGATLLMLYWILKSSNNEKVRNKTLRIFLLLVLWLSLQAVLTLTGFYYENLDSLPPKILLFGVLPNIVLIIILFVTKKGRMFIDSLSIEKVTYLSLVRIPIEFVLLWLFINKAIPKSMTFEGNNFDILMGITAPLILYFGYRKCKLDWKSILIWNVVGIILLLNVVITGLLSAPFPLQKFAFDQPNIGLLYFPFSWLPIFVVPMVILGHLISIRQLIKKKENAIEQCISDNTP